MRTAFRVEAGNGQYEFWPPQYQMTLIPDINIPIPPCDRSVQNPEHKAGTCHADDLTTPTPTKGMFAPNTLKELSSKYFLSVDSCLSLILSPWESAKFIFWYHEIFRLKFCFVLLWLGDCIVLCFIALSDPSRKPPKPIENMTSTTQGGFCFCTVESFFAWMIVLVKATANYFYIPSPSLSNSKPDRVSESHVTL